MCTMWSGVLCGTISDVHVGGGLVPTVEGPLQYNITSADLTTLRAELTASVRSTLSKDVHRHVEEHVDRVLYTCTCTCTYTMYMYSTIHQQLTRVCDRHACDRHAW